MTSPELKQTIQYAIQDCGIAYRTDYSGRSMYGRKCFGVYGSIDEIHEFLRLVTEAAHENAMDPEEEEDIWDEWMDVCFNYRQDSMGLDTIYYWPEIYWTEEEDD